MKHPNKIVDMHTHMFNARYLPLKGIFRAFGVRDEFVTPLARFCWFLTRYSDFNLGTREFSEQFENVSVSGSLRTPYTKNKIVDVYLESLASDCAHLVEESLTSNSLIIDDSVDMIDSIENCVVFMEIEDAANLLISSIFSIGDLSELMSLIPYATGHDGRKRINLESFVLRDFFKNFLRYAFKFVEEAIDKIDFAWNLTHSEKQILTRLQAYYKDVVPHADLVHYMMDIAYPYNQNPRFPNDGYTPYKFYKSPRGSQLFRMHGLSQCSQKQLIGFSAFDPVRFHKMKSDQEEVIAHLEAAKSFGMLGFKFYPPMGFRAAINDDPAIDNIVDIFLDYCVRTETPVFAHCTPGGFELSKETKTGLNSDPIFWRAALEKPGRYNLRLCLGHAGGGMYDVTKPCSSENEMSYGWLASNTQWNSSTNYAFKVADLCREFPNVYCELANIDTIIDDVSLRSNFKVNLIRELNSTHGRYRFSDKIMYGTDWHMVGMVNDAVKYFEILVEIFNDPKLIPYFDQFFSETAKRYLNIGIE